MPALTRVLLVRHGESEWNATGRWQGQADPPLTDLGRAQARHAAAAIGNVDAIVSSDLRRAAETAAIIADVLGVGPVVVDERLRERNAGEWQGLTRDEIEERWPGALADGRRPPGYEADESLVARALGALVALARDLGPGDVLAITHGGLLVALEQYAGLERQRIANLEGRWFAVSPTGELTPGERVELIDHELVTLSLSDQR